MKYSEAKLGRVFVLRLEKTITGCVRRGVKVWQVMEVVLWELTETTARRLPDKATGFELLQP